jgi:hypothetical protein
MRIDSNNGCFNKDIGRLASDLFVAYERLKADDIYEILDLLNHKDYIKCKDIKNDLISEGFTCLDCTYCGDTFCNSKDHDPDKVLISEKTIKCFSFVLNKKYSDMWSLL